MRSHTKYLTVKVPERMGFVNLTDDVEKAVKESGVREGLCLVNSMHITSSVFINDNEPGLHEDYQRWLEWLAPYDPSPERYHHNRTGEDNGDAHHKRQVMGREVVVAITAGKLDFGPWEQNLLRRVRRPPFQAHPDQSDRRVGRLRDRDAARYPTPHLFRRSARRASQEGVQGKRQMIACIIEYAVTAGMEDRLGEAFAALIPEIQAIDGFVSMDNFQSQTRPGVLLEVSYWRDEAALQCWIDNAAHREKMLLGRKEIFSWYKISSVEIKRQIDWTRKAS